MKKIIIIIAITGFITINFSCKKYLDVIPDNVATLDHAFALRSQAIKYLFTCYSYMPSDGSLTSNPAFYGSDELYLTTDLRPEINTNAWQIAYGNQSVVSSYINYWEGKSNGKELFDGIRNCNIFLENIGTVPDLGEIEHDRWVAEVKVLKAYYHFFLVRLYGPIPIKKVNTAIDAPSSETNSARSPVDSCFNYIAQLLDEASANLPLTILDPANEMGRITKPIALSLKAKVLVYAASPLFNGNTDYVAFIDPKTKTPLFDQNVSSEKWEKAVEACKEAIDICTEAGLALYHYRPGIVNYKLSTETEIEMSIRNSICDKWNSEVIWGNSQSWAGQGLQVLYHPRGLDPNAVSNVTTRGNISPNLKMTELFYTKNGVPITEDKTFNYNNRYSLRTGTADERFYIKEGYLTAEINFDREPRYYANLGFDGGIWYGQGRYDETNSFYVQSKKGQPMWAPSIETYSATGLYCKKFVHFQNVAATTSVSYSVTTYPWPTMRLADLYLLYAESVNEASGPVLEATRYLDSVRVRAGIAKVKDAWDNFSTNPSKYTTKEGLRSIIHNERYIELAFEGSRFYDMRRWKEATTEMNSAITGWDRNQTSANGYYRPIVLGTNVFRQRDYFWPITEGALVRNKGLVQNPNW